MKVPEVSKCCFCATVRTGTIIIGALAVTIAVLGLIIVCTTNTDPRMIVHTVKDRDTAKIALIVGLCIAIVIDGLLLLGAYYKNTPLMLPWLVLSAVFTIMNLLSGVVTVILALVKGLIGAAFWILISTTLSFFLGMYLLLVVYTYYRQLQDEKRNSSQYAATWNP